MEKALKISWILLEFWLRIQPCDYLNVSLPQSTSYFSSTIQGILLIILSSISSSDISDFLYLKGFFGPFTLFIPLSQMLFTMQPFKLSLSIEFIFPWLLTFLRRCVLWCKMSIKQKHYMKHTGKEFQALGGLGRGLSNKEFTMEFPRALF